MTVDCMTLLVWTGGDHRAYSAAQRSLAKDGWRYDIAIDAWRI